jgi:hypothetical protein
MFRMFRMCPITIRRVLVFSETLSTCAHIFLLPTRGTTEGRRCCGGVLRAISADKGATQRVHPLEGLDSITASRDKNYVSRVQGREREH